MKITSVAVVKLYFPFTYVMRAAFIAIATCTFPAVATAQSSANSDPAAGQSTPTEDLQEIVVTAQRRSELLSQVPISVQAVSGEMLTKAAVLDSRLLETVSPTISFTGGFNSSATQLVIRGVSSVAFEGGVQPSVALVVDGVPLTRSSEFMLDFADIERVEVLNGPQGTLFGKNATGGVINVLTKKPTDSFEGSVDALATTDKEYSIRGIINMPLGEGLAARIVGFYRNQAPLIENIGPGPDAGGARAAGFNARVLAQLGSDATFLLSGGYNKSRNSYSVILPITPISGPLGVLQLATTGPIFHEGSHVVNIDGHSYDWLSNWNVTGELNWNISDKVSLVSVTGFRHSSEHAGTDADATPVGVNEGVGFTPNPLNYPLMWINFGDGHVKDRLNYGSQEFRLNVNGDRVNVLAGVYLQTLRERRASHLPLILAASYAGIAGVPPATQFFSDSVTDARLKNDTAAVFADATYKVTPTINVFAGVRYTIESLNVRYHRDNYFNPVTGFFNPVTLVNSAPPSGMLDYDRGRNNRSVSGRAGLQWHPTERQNYYISYNRGYKGPAADISNATNGISPLVSPEIATAWEVGIKRRFGALSVDLAVYTQLVKDIQQTSLLPGTIFTQLVNAGNLRSKGVEFNVRARPASGLTFNLGGVYTDAKYKGGRFTCNPTEVPGVTPGCDADNSKSLTGQRAVSTPRWKFNSSLDYDYDLSGPLTLTSHVAFNWQDSIQYQLNNDPLTLEPKRGILNASISLKTDDNRITGTIFVNNITNKFYYSKREEADFFIGRSYGRAARDFARYAGARLTYTF
ncbi:MAG: TonB-dependent receptor [Sphingomonadales bacterium]|nr:TonB-dependent receptor [Sphingomonadales bacterium]